jgi:hypothetical protein
MKKVRETNSIKESLYSLSLNLKHISPASLSEKLDKKKLLGFNGLNKA